MKKLFIFCPLLILSFGSILTAQTYPHPNGNIYQKIFDESQAYYENVCLTSSANEFNMYGDGASYYLEGLLIMFESTGDISYLDDFVRVSHEMISNRSDYRAGEQYALPFWSTFSNAGNCSIKYGLTYQTGRIISPMAHFVKIISVDVINTIGAMSVSSLIVTFNGIVINSYLDYANWLNIRVKEVINYYNAYWVSGIGIKDYYSHPCYGTSPNASSTANYNLWWGPAYLYSYLSNQTSDPTFATSCIEKVRTIAWVSKANFLDNNCSNFPRYRWSHNKWNDNNNCNDDPEDISHGNSMLEFVYLCYKYDIKSLPGGDYPNGYFTYSDFQLFTNTLIDIVNYDVLSFHNNVDGTSSTHDNPNMNDNSLIESIANWINLSVFPDASLDQNANNHVYHMVTDYYSKTLENPSQITNTQGVQMLAIAKSCYFLKNMEVVARNSTPGGAHNNFWQGVDGDDLDNDGLKNEVVSVRNFDGGIYFWRIQNNSGSHYNPSFGTIDMNNIGYKIVGSGAVINGPNCQWKGITIGNFDNATPGNEIAAIRDVDGALFVWRVINTGGVFSLQNILFNNTAGPNVDWRGISSKDIDGDGIEELIAIRSNPGNLYVWKVIQSGSTYSLQSKIAVSLGVNQNWASFDVGDLNNDQTTEICAARNSDASVWIWRVNVGTVWTLTNVVTDYSFGAASNWNRIVIADYNGDGKNEILMHRTFDGALMYAKLSGSSLSIVRTEYIPSNYDFRVFGKVRMPGNNLKDNIISLRNSDGDILCYNIKFPIITGLPHREFADDLIVKDNTVQIMPNPSNGFIKILFQEPISGQLEIIDVFGKVIYSEKIVELNNTELNLSLQLNGIYFYSIVTSNGEKLSGKIIISK